ncbi:hypothetical protein [Pedobacter sp. MR2016-24]|uniref:hypothetical protein n=1 Tax=Pedobacter sp. MR2016-24 TaxID=2994466 RepID=UPI0022478073|nr:hypothetical protein [Pedobacter sp. MR2016-24]MCX2482784.1 hypothetical protein [Pedobacter sp. MR2016-24]
MKILKKNIKLTKETLFVYQKHATGGFSYSDPTTVLAHTTNTMFPPTVNRREQN